VLASLHVEEHGQGEVVLALHSGGMSSRQWRGLRDALAPTHRVVLPDFLGCGQNPPWPAGEPFAIGLDVDGVARVIDGLGAPVHLVGHSYGGLVALLVAQRDPGRIRSLAVYDPVAFGVLHDPEDAEGLADLARAARDPVFTDDARGGSDAWMQAFVDYWNGAGAWRALPEASRAQFLRVGRKVYLEVTSLTEDRTPARAYAAIEAPVLLLHGERSPVAARRVGAVLAAALPRAELVVIEGAGHMGPLTHVGEVVGRVVEHVKGAAGG